MFRTRAARFVSTALLLFAGSVEPIWEIGHAVGHAEAFYHSHEHPESADTATPASMVSAVPDADGHGHPLFQAPVRPSADLTLTAALLPANAIRLPLESLTVRGSAFPGISARASPRTAGTIQPRAPPLA